jgi:hypothetical protein
MGYRIFQAFEHILPPPPSPEGISLLKVILVIFYMHMRLAVNGILEDFVKKGD